MKIQVLVMILVLFLFSGCGSEHTQRDTDVSEQIPTHSLSRTEKEEPVLTLIEGSFDWKGEGVSGEGFTLSLQKENVFEVAFTNPFVEISESEVHIVDNYGAILKAIGNEKLTIGIAPIDPEPYRITFRVLGYTLQTIKNPT